MKRAVLVAVALATLSLSACTATGPEVRQAWQAEIDRLSQATDSVSEQIGVVRQALADYQEQLATLDPDDPLVQRISGAVATANERLSILQMYESRIDGQLADAQARLDAIEDEAGGLESDLTMIGGTAQSVGAVVPGPWGPALAGIGTLIGAAGGILAKRRRDEQEAMVFAIDQGKRQHPELASAFDSAGQTINAAMGPKVSKSVRKLRKGA
ncbi:MAG TPA: hypothetical protein VIG24_08150 [Acidimicrobiia bacterium]